MTSRPAGPRALLDFINRLILKGVAPAGNLKRVFTGKSGQNRKKILGEFVFYASETIQNCKNPTGNIDTLMNKKNDKEKAQGTMYLTTVCGVGGKLPTRAADGWVESLAAWLCSSTSRVYSA